MKRIAQFEKVSFEEFCKGFNLHGEDNMKMLREWYDNIKLPKRATKGSAGYDFFAPYEFAIVPHYSEAIPTGIRVKMEDGWVLKIYPRSGLGFKYKVQLNNTVGIIDQDYYYSDNEGHIFIKVSRGCTEIDGAVVIKQGEAFAQGIFSEYGVTYDDNVEEIRNGGIGSTSK